MMTSKRLLFAVFIACLTHAGGTLAEESRKPGNLLIAPAARIESTSLIGDQEAKVAALKDGNPQTVAEFEVGQEKTIDLVVGFGEAMVAPEAVIVRLADTKKGPAPTRIDVLASTVSPRTGFRSLRADPLDASKPVQSFSFRPAAARWIMIRLSAANDQKTMALAEIEVVGHPGPPQTVYAFSETPARAIDILSKLETANSVSLAVSLDEKRAFEKVKSGHVDPDAFADVALLASGIRDANARAAYLKQLNGLAAQAKAALTKVQGPAKRGEALLQWVHKNVLTQGYRSAQTDLSVILDRKTFNCVSSAVVYNILALKLGLDARAIEVPDHAFSIVYDGTTHMDVETTTALGFNPAREEIQEFERITGFRYIPQSHQDQRREISEAGLAALIYYNHGVMLSDAKRHYDALASYFRAMSLDPEFASAAKNALASLANWSFELSRQKQWRQALDVAGIGIALAPNDALLMNNRVAVWNNWAHSLIDAGQPAEALAVLKRAQEALPNDGFEKMEAWVYIKPGEDLVKAQNWDGALAATEAGLGKINASARQELADWRNELYLRWTNAEIGRQRFDAAASVLKRGTERNPKDGRLHDTVAYLGQEWARHAGDTRYADGLAVLAALDRQFPGNGSLGEAAKSFVWRHLSTMANAGRIEDGLAAIEEAGPVLKGNDAKSEIGAFLFDTVAKARMASGKWEDAAKLYAQGLMRLPGNGLLVDNVAYLAQEWQKTAYASGGPEAVAAVTSKLAALFPNMESLARSGSNQINRTVSELVNAGRFDQAIAVLMTAASQLSPQDVTSLNELIYDSWAQTKMKGGHWEEAADIYVAGIAAAGITRLIQNNVVYLAQEWQKAAYTSGGETEMAMVTEKLVAKFPNIPELGKSAGQQIERLVNDHVRSGQFDAALAVLQGADLQLSPDDRQSLNELIFDNWARTKMQQADWDAAAGLYARGLAAASASSLLRNNITYLTQQWAQAAFAQGGVKAVVQVAGKAAAAFPSLPDVREAPAHVVSNAIAEKADRGAFPAGLDLLTEAAELLSPQKQRELTEYVYDRWARSFIDKKQWREAVGIYDQGLKRLPDSGLFKQNRDYCLGQQK